MKHQFNITNEIQSAYGFYKFYFDNLVFYPDRETCFNHCNAFFETQYGYPRHSSWADFALNFSIKSEKNNCKIDLIREPSISHNMLLRFFGQKGFNAWDQFRPVVLAFYPTLSVSKLHDFYTGENIDAPTLEKVYFTYQILS